MRTRRGTLACQARPHTRGGEGRLQIRGQWAFEHQILPGLGVRQQQSICVQKLAFKAECGTTLPVKRVSNHRMPSRFKVNPYLVCAPGLGAHLQESVLPCLTDYLVARECFAEAPLRLRLALL